jgi:CheY-like chemotaxis protein
MGSDDKAIILFLEDDGDSRFYLKRLLRRGGYQVIAADDEEDALELMAFFKFKPDLILAHLEMKPEEIMAAGRRLKERAGLDGAIPVVVIAEKGGDGLEGENWKSDGKDYIYFWDEDSQLTHLLKKIL